MSFNPHLPSDPAKDGNSEYSNEALKKMTPPGGKYAYPDDRDWRPGSDLHEYLVSLLGECVYEAFDEISQHHDTMREMDSLLTAYIPLSDYERSVKQNDSRKPVAIQIPVTYSVLQTLHTNYLSLLSANEGIDRFAPVAPEDRIGALLAEEVLNNHSTHYKELLSHSTQCLDFLKYGFGFQTPIWTEEYEYQMVENDFDAITGEPIETREEYLAYEGNRVYNIDPYLSYPDPNCHITDIASMEYFAYDVSTNLNNVLNRELQGTGNFFNARYLNILLENDVAVTNPRVLEAISGHENDDSNNKINDPRNARTGNVVHETVIYKWLIPNMMEYRTSRGSMRRFGDSNFPELWMFVIAGDRIITYAERIPHLHNRIPVVCAAPESNGYGASPVAHLEMTRGVQDTLTYRVNMENEFFRKFRRGRWAGDPDAVDIQAVLNGDDFVSVHRIGARGRNISDVLQNVPIADPFGGTNMQSIGYLQSIIQQASGATNNLQGIMETRGERRSATEAQGARMGALSRIEKMLLLAFQQSMCDLSYLKLRQVQQYMSNETYVRITGRNEQVLLEEYGKRKLEDPEGYAEDAYGLFPVDPRELDVAFDVQPIDVTRRADEFAAQHVAIFQSMLQNPLALQEVDMVRYWLHMARHFGFKNASDFLRRTQGQTQTTIVPDAELQQQVQAGNVAPVGQLPQGVV